MASETTAHPGHQGQSPSPAATPTSTGTANGKVRVRATRVAGFETSAPARARARAGAVGPAWAPDQRTSRLVEMFGNKGLADLLGVSQSQPSRWKTGEEVPGPAVAPRLVDLDHVVARLLLVWDQSVVLDWLKGANRFLEGARPIDVIVTRGSNEVVDAIEAQASGAYA